MLRATTLLILALSGPAILTGCPKGNKVDAAALETSPKANFEAGVNALQPDRRGNIDYVAAYDFFKRSAELNGGARAAFNAGLAAEQLGRADEAFNHYKASFDTDPAFAAGAFSYARMLRERGDASGAANVLGLHSEAYPDDLELRAEYIDALIAADRLDEALTLAQETLRADSKSSLAYRNLSALYLRQGNLRMARLMGEKALSLNENDADAHNNLGVIHLRQKNEPAALDAFGVAIELQPEHFEANMNLGAIALNSGDYELAHASFETAVAVRDTDHDARLGLAVAKRGTGDIEGAATLYDALIKANPAYGDAYFNASLLHERFTQDFDQALAYLEQWRAAEGSPDGSHPLFTRKAEVEAAKRAEEERKRLEEERRKAEEERKERAQKALQEFAASVSSVKKQLAEYAHCLPEEIIGEVGGIIEMVEPVIEAGEAEQAADFREIFDSYYVPMVSGAVDEACASGAAPDEAPSEEDPAPEGDTEDEAPAAPEEEAE